MYSYSGIVHSRQQPAQAAPSGRKNRWLCACVLAALLLGACTPIRDGQPGADSRYVQTRAARLERAGHHSQAAELYEQLAARDDSSARFWLKAANQWHAAGEWRDVERTLNRITVPLDDEQALQRALLGASAAVSLGASSRARAWLDARPTEIPDRARSAVMWLEVRLALSEGDIRKGIELSDAREMWLARAEDIRLGRRALLNELANEERLSAAEPAGDPDQLYAGWLDLARIRSDADRDPFAVGTSLRKWHDQYPEHPAAVLLPELLAEYKQLLDYPQRLAVMLPMSGRFAAAGEAVRDGILAAYLRQEETRPGLRFYDTNTEDITSLYSRAVSDGADFVIGPLTRDALDKLAVIPQLALPTLALNNLSEQALRPGIYQFGLTPEDEARQAAQRLLATGLVQGIALVPASEWGGRIFGAFRDELESAGGILLDYQEYAPRDEDFSGPITTVLHLAESRTRYRNLAGVLGRRLEFEPRRREDVQFIFLAATPETGRLMRPQLRFHYASDLPVFATSGIYEANPARNNDLNGISFVDIPWVIDDDPEIVALREQLSSLFPGRMRSWPRLYALGYDAYRLVPALFSGQLMEEEVVRGLTGDLTMNRDGQIQRKMRWAQFSGGVPTLLEDAGEIEPGVEPGSETGTETSTETGRGQGQL